MFFAKMLYNLLIIFMKPEARSPKPEAYGQKPNTGTYGILNNLIPSMRFLYQPDV
jgi:hypothetical protein